MVRRSRVKKTEKLEEVVEVETENVLVDETEQEIESVVEDEENEIQENVKKSHHNLWKRVGCSHSVAVTRTAREVGMSEDEVRRHLAP